MKVSEELISEKIFNIPVTIFDVIQIKTTGDKGNHKEEKKVKEKIKGKEEHEPNFLFPISSLF